MKYVIWNTSFNKYLYEHYGGFDHFHDINKASHYPSYLEASRAMMRRPKVSDNRIYSVDEAMVAEIMRE
jgi:hypothetical protein